jgi:isopentenyl-diphosphate delta-isomerase
MTGGDHAELVRINRHLAEAAEACGVALSVGSQRIQFEHPLAEQSFALRQFAPSTPLIANLGAVQLNYGFDHHHAQQAIDTLAADALFLHLNPLQEAIQPEGNTRFAGLWDKIAQLTQQLSTPVLLKEVGSGLSPALIRRGMAAGIAGFDLAGKGGTSWSRIEHHRQTEISNHSGLTFQDWGLPTPWILESCQDIADQTHLIASGGVRTGVDVVKSLILGARMAGLAAPLLKPAMTSTQAVIDQIEQIKRDIRIAVFLLGGRSLEDIWLAKHLIRSNCTKSD